jgi:hypothetical protein
LYRIVSGKYRECCGLIGSGVVYSLPNSDQSFIKLTVDAQSGIATMDFLGADQQTVFTRTPCPGAAIDFSFPFGFLVGNSFFFHVDPGPPPYQKYWNYSASNSAEGLRIDGVLGITQTGCADTPTQFSHSNLLAVLVRPPKLSVLGFFPDRGTRLFVQGTAGETNVIEASADLRNWTPISTNVMDYSTCPICPYVIFEDADSTNLTHRFYRVSQLAVTLALERTSLLSAFTGDVKNPKAVARTPKQLRNSNQQKR